MVAEQVVDFQRGTTEEAMGAPDAQLPVPAMVGGGEKELLAGGDLRRLLQAKHMPDLEKGIKEGMDAQAGQVVPVVADDDAEHERLLLKDLRYHQVVGVAVAGCKMNPGQKKWRPYYWLLAATASVIVLNNHIHAAPKDQQLFPQELAMFAVLLCAICLIILSVKQMM